MRIRRAIVILALTAAPASGQGVLRGQAPAFAPDGRLAIASHGDLWVVPAGLEGGQALRITSGAAWDRDPVWSPDGRTLAFVSDGNGGTDLFAVAADGSGAPVRLTDSAAPEFEPAYRPDGALVFVRGAGASADLWERSADGTERRLTESSGGEREPAVSATGRIAYIAIRDGRRTLRVRDATGADTLLNDTHSPARPAWSPDGSRIAFAGGGRTAGVWITPVDGAWLVLATRDSGVPAWSPDGAWLALAEPPAPEPGYNGDPARIADPSAGDDFADEGEIRRVRAPEPPLAAEGGIPVAFAAPRDSLNAAAFERVWRRTAELYFAGSDPWSRNALAAWQRAADGHRQDAIGASDAGGLERAVHALLKERPPLRPAAEGRAAVSSAHPLATAAGVEMLEAGGNVVDAAVAVSFALGVVEPDASGVGGYGEMLIHLEGMSEPVAIEFMTRLPEAHSVTLQEVESGDAHGALLANVPGTVAGMELAWRRHGSGRLPWARLLEPAIRLAEQGFILDDAFTTTLAREREQFERYQSSRALFFRDGEPLQPGDTLRNPDLAWTLRQIAEGGADAFYRGAVAEKLVADLRAHGHPITRDDMRRYFAAPRRPVRTTYRGHAVFSGPPPVTGGASLVAKLNLLELAPAGTSMTDDAAKLHAMLEAVKLQPSTQNRIADPDLWPTDVTPFESKDTARARWRCFDVHKASAPDVMRSGSCTRADGASRPDASSSSYAHAEDADAPCATRAQPAHCRNTGTTSFAVADADGNAVSVTQTLGTWGGNFYVTPGLGFLYNDKFTSYRDDPAAYGARLPYARNTTIITPTLVYDGDGPTRKPLLAVGAAGNAWITAAVYNAVVGVIDHGLDVQEALELPRMLPGGGGIQYEDGFSPDALRELRVMGHEFRRISLKGELRMGYGAAVMVKDGRAIAGADPRRSGAAGAVR